MQYFAVLLLNLQYMSALFSRGGVRGRELPAWRTSATLSFVYAVALVVALVVVVGLVAAICISSRAHQRFFEDVHVLDVPVPVEEGIPAIVIRTGERSWSDLDPSVRRMYAKFEQDNPGWRTVYFSGKRCRKFVLDHFGRRTCEAYDKLVPGAFRADLFRYCAVYVLGGVYADFTFQFLKPIDGSMLDRSADSLLLVNDRFFGPLRQLYNALFAARPRHPFLKSCVDIAVRNIESELYGENTLAITGPLMFRRAFDEFAAQSHVVPVPVRLQLRHVGDATIVSIKTGEAYVADPMRKHRHKSMGSKHRPYTEIWNERAIYRLPGREQWNYPAAFSKDAIPAIIFRTGEDEETDLHPLIRALHRETEQRNPPWKTRYFSARARRAFIDAHFDGTVLAAYDALVPNAYRADLFRYCALFALGGLYADFGVNFLAPIDALVDRDNDGIVLCHDLIIDNRPGLLNGVLAARPAHPLFAMCIRQIVANVATQFYGINAHHPTGPLMLRETFDEWRKSDLDAPMRLEMMHYKAWHISCNDDDSKECAILCKGPNYKELLKSPQPHYGEFWRERKVYG